MKRNLYLTLVLILSLFIILISLGFWQLNRLGQKQQLISQIATAITKPVERKQCKDLLENPELYRSYMVEGRYLKGKNILVYAGPMAIRGQPGYLLITPFECTDGSLVAVNRGWFPEYNLDQNLYNEDENLREEQITLMREDKIGYFTPDNNFNYKFVFYIDLYKFADYWRLIGLNKDFYFMRNFVDTKFPVGKNPTIKIRNDHLSYAITWFSLAFILVVIAYFRFWQKIIKK